MVTPDLLDYIKQHLQGGHSRQAIEQELLKAGWHQEDINAGFAQVESGAPLPPVPGTASGASAGAGGKLPGAPETFRYAWNIYRDRFWTLIGISIIPAILIFSGAFLVGGGWLLTNLFKTSLGTTGYAATNIVAAILMLVLAVAAIYISLWSQTALIFAIKDAEERIGIKEAFRRASHKIGSFFGASLLSGLAVFGGLLLLIVPGIIFAVWFSLSTYVVVGDNTTAMSALKRSKDYVKGYWGAVFWRFFFLFLVYLGIGIGVGILNAIIMAALRDSNIAAPVTSFIQQLINFVLAPLAAAYGYLIYKNLKAIKGESAIPADKKGTLAIVLAVLGVVVVIAGLLASVVLLALNSARAKSRDAKRLADVRMIASAVELYYNDNNSYPPSLQSLSPLYLGAAPKAPTPADGQCSTQQNTYTYQLVDKDHYKVTFCLGGAMGGYFGGSHTLTEAGIDPKSNQFDMYPGLQGGAQSIPSASSSTLP